MIITVSIFYQKWKLSEDQYFNLMVGNPNCIGTETHERILTYEIKKEEDKLGPDSIGKLLQVIFERLSNSKTNPLVDCISQLNKLKIIHTEMKFGDAVEVIFDKESSVWIRNHHNWVKMRVI